MMNVEQERITPKNPIARPRWFYKQWMLAGNPAYFFEMLSREFGDFVHYRGLFDFYLINDPALVKHVLQETHDKFDKQSVIYKRFANVFGTGLVVSEGAAWRRQRKLIQPHLGPKAVERYFEGMVDSLVRMLERWEVKRVEGRVLDVSLEMNRLTLEIAGRALFQDRFTERSDDIEHWTTEINRFCAKPPLPIIRSFWFPSRRNFRMKRTLREFHQFMQEMIDRQRNAEPSGSLLDVLLNSKHEESGELMSDTEIRDEMLGMIIGGHETSSAALTWVWYELANHPEVAAKLRSELNMVLQGQPIRLEHLPRLKYTKMVIEETLRLHPPFWFENRNVTRDVELAGQTIPKGALVVFSRYSLHRHSCFWKEPDRFFPERFDPDSPENPRSRYASIPYGGGPRICIGIHFATMELIVALAMMAQRFQVQIDRSNRHAMSAKLTMTPSNGLRVTLASAPSS
jgi:cytochrome P450